MCRDAECAGKLGRHGKCQASVTHWDMRQRMRKFSFLKCIVLRKRPVEHLLTEVRRRGHPRQIRRQINRL